MKSLRAVLREYVDPIDLGDHELAPIDVEKLTAQLGEVSRSNEYYFAVCVVMVLAPFLVLLWATLRHAGGTGAITATLGASLLVSARFMLQVWREKVTSDLVITLAGSLERDALRSVIAELLRRPR
jgi:hypothetical protein